MSYQLLEPPVWTSPELLAHRDSVSQLLLLKARERFDKHPPKRCKRRRAEALRDGQLVISFGVDLNVMAWDAYAPFKRKWMRKLHSPVRLAYTDGTSSCLYCILRDDSVVILDGRTGRTLRDLTVPVQRAQVYDTFANVLVTARGSTGVLEMQMTNYQMPLTCWVTTADDAHRSPPTIVKICPEHGIVYSGDSSGKTRRFDCIGLLSYFSRRLPQSVELAWWLSLVDITSV